MTTTTTKLLCLSNGHGEDGIALRILQALQQQPHPPELAALPIVGEGHLYRHYGIPIVGPTQAMPSGGFVYMEGRQLVRDLQGGLVQLTLAQLKALRNWTHQGGMVLAVGDIVPLLFAWWSGADYAFVGTAKSEYYLRDEQGWLPRQSWFERMERWSGSVYLPWDRWLLSRPRCKAVFPRDSLTHTVLQRWQIPSFDEGNPMMDDLTVSEKSHQQFEAILASLAPPEQSSKAPKTRLTFVLLPGSRSPEAYENWSIIIQSVSALIRVFGNQKQLLFLGAIAPQLEFAPLQSSLESYGWRAANEPLVQSLDQRDPSFYMFERYHGKLILTHAFNQCLYHADFALAMAGTATEQFVGLGKPALSFVGQGPQFTPQFAEAQTRLLGAGVTLVDQPNRAPDVVTALLQDPDRLQLIQTNGLRRMGAPGAAQRIARRLQQLTVPEG
jgi:uncharacterized protein (TIGR03492 family)